MRPTRRRRRELNRAARKRVGAAAAVGFRARIILALAGGRSVSEVARVFAISRDQVRRWRDRYHERGVRGLRDRRRSGRPREIGPELKCEIVALACDKPALHGVEYRQLWTIDTLLGVIRARQEARGERPISRTSVIRVLTEAEIRPHRMRVWLHSTDPEFRPKVTEICQLYRDPPAGATLVCIDEMTGVQALGRKHPGRSPAPRRAGKFEFEYVRNGTRTLIAAFNPVTGAVYGEMGATRTGEDLVRFMEALARRHPSGDVHVIWDNLNIHYDGREDRWTKFNAEHGRRFHFHFTPKHASWVNQVELFFAFVQRRVLRYRAFDTTEELEQAVLGFIDYWNREEHRTFDWTFRGYPLELKREAA